SRPSARPPRRRWRRHPGPPPPSRSPPTPRARSRFGPSSSVTRPVYQPITLEPRHEAAETRPDLFDRVLLGFFAELAEVRQPAAVLRHPLVGELARLDVAEDLLHGGARVVGDDPLAARHVAVLGGVADRVAHVRDAAFVDQVHDELHLVQTLEVRHLGRIPRLDQRLVAGTDELRDPAAEDGLLAEEIRLRLVLEGGLDDAGARAADGLRIREPH